MDERDPRSAIAGPRLELEDGSFDHAAKRSFPTPLGALGPLHRRRPPRGRRRRSPQYRAPERRATGQVDAVNGAFMLIRRAALDEVGLFDEGYWMYMEDLDLCYRLRGGGLGHLVRARGDGDPRQGRDQRADPRARLNRAFHYGMYRFYRKHYAPRHNADLERADLRRDLAPARRLTDREPSPAPPHFHMIPIHGGGGDQRSGRGG